MLGVRVVSQQRGRYCSSCYMSETGHAVLLQAVLSRTLAQKLHVQKDARGTSDPVAHRVGIFPALRLGRHC
jgi:hypothetical protein